MIFWSFVIILIQRVICFDIILGCFKVFVDWVKLRGFIKFENVSLVEYIFCDYFYEQDVFLFGLVFFMYCLILKMYYVWYDFFIIFFFLGY